VEWSRKQDGDNCLTIFSRTNGILSSNGNKESNSHSEAERTPKKFFPRGGPLLFCSCQMAPAARVKDSKKS
jgi:hypothetical protein